MLKKDLKCPKKSTDQSVDDLKNIFNRLVDTVFIFLCSDFDISRYSSVRIQCTRYSI